MYIFQIMLNTIKFTFILWYINFLLIGNGSTLVMISQQLVCSSFLTLTDWMEKWWAHTGSKNLAMCMRHIPKPKRTVMPTLHTAISQHISVAPLTCSYTCQWCLVIWRQWWWYIHSVQVGRYLSYKPLGRCMVLNRGSYSLIWNQLKYKGRYTTELKW